MRIDSHHHLWDLEIAPRGWLAGDALAPINRTFSMDDFYAERASAKIDKSILVQTLPDYDEMKEFLKNMAKNMGGIGKNGKMNTSAMNTMIKKESMKERLRSKMENKKQNTPVVDGVIEQQSENNFVWRF